MIIMKIYVGYVLGDYAQAWFIGTSENKVQKELDETKTKAPKWVEEYELSNDNVIELDYK